MKTLLEILLDREAELNALAASLGEQLQKVKDHQDELALAMKAIGAEPQKDEASTPAGRNSPRRASERTIKKSVVDALVAAGHGMTALEILSAINSALGLDYPRTSLSPQLSRLKAEGCLTREGVVWSLTDEAQMLGYPLPPEYAPNKTIDPDEEEADRIFSESTDASAPVAAE